MNRIIATLTMCLMAVSIVAQEKADIEVSYSVSKANFKTGNPDRSETTSQYILIANANTSKFYSPMTEYLDSLESTPEGKAKYKEMARSAFQSGDRDKAPKRDGRYYVIKSSKDSRITTYDVNGLEKYVMEEQTPQWDWQISDSTKIILGYECQMATTTFHGREWTVWFTPEIPIMNGPWKLGGLPGLIMEATEPSGVYSFTATGLQTTERNINPVYSSDSYDKIDRKDFFREKRKMTDNPLTQMNSQLGALGISISGDPNSIKSKSREELDYIETDY